MSKRDKLGSCEIFSGIETKGRDCFDEVDKQILFALFNNLDMGFYKMGRLHMFLSDLAMEIYKGNSEADEQNLKDRFVNMWFTRLSTSTGESKIFRSIFSSLDVNKDENGKWQVSAGVSPMTADKVLKLQFDVIYEKQLKKVKDDHTLKLFSLIQTQRIKNAVFSSNLLTAFISFDDLFSIELFEQMDEETACKKVELALLGLKNNMDFIEDIKQEKEGFAVGYSRMGKCEIEKVKNTKITYKGSVWDFIMED